MLNKEKLNLIAREDASVDPKKKNKGITLIALIITIIVMIILVAVTVNVALNGGIFDKASKATTETTIAKEKEELLSYIYGESYDAVKGGVNLGKLKNELNNTSDWEAEVSSDNTYLIATNKKSNNKYKIYSNGKIEGLNSDSSNKTTKYFKIEDEMIILVDENGNEMQDAKLATTGDWVFYDYSYTDSTTGVFVKSGELLYVGTGAQVNLQAPITAQILSIQESEEVDEHGDPVYYLYTIESEQSNISDYDEINLNLAALNQNPNAIQEVNLNNSIVTLEAENFKGLSSLKTITGANGITEIGDYCFNGCESLKEIELKGLTYIGVNAFTGSGLTKITLPGSGITGVYYTAFDNCPNLTQIVVDGPEAECDYKTMLDHAIESSGQTITVTYSNT